MYLPSNPNYHLVNISCILLLIAFIIAFVIAFFVKSSSPKKRLCHIGGTIFFICSMTYASLFHIYDLMFSFSAKNISIDAAFILQQNGSLFFGFLCMGAFSIFSILIDYKKIKTVPTAATCALACSICSVHTLHMVLYLHQSTSNRH